MKSVPVVQIESLEVSLGSGAARVHILKGLDLTVNAGEAIGIVGPSGSGKSTLLMAMAGLERSNAGSILIRETDITALNEDQLARFRGENIGVVFQSFHLIPTMTALENVAVPLEFAGHPDPFSIARQELESVGLGSRLQHYPSQLSGGEQQRVGIARALAPRPALLIADEPTGNLDTKTGMEISDLLFEANKHRNMSLILITHDATLADRCHRVVSVQDGKLVPDASKVSLPA